MQGICFSGDPEGFFFEKDNDEAEFSELLHELDAETELALTEAEIPHRDSFRGRMRGLPDAFFLLFYLSEGDATKHKELRKIPLRIIRGYYYYKRVSELNELKATPKMKS